MGRAEARKQRKKAKQRKKRRQKRSVERNELREKARARVANLCQLDMHGNLLRTAISTQNLNRIKNTIHELGITEIQMERELTQAEYCKLFRGYMFKEEKCGDRVCCQAMTEDGTRCKRPASEYFTIDLTQRSIVPRIPDFIQRTLGDEKTEELKLIGFANSCCFYCWQHAVMYGAKKLTSIHNIAYYSTHPEDLLSVFFENVESQKLLGLIPIPWGYRVSGLREPDQIIKHGYKVAGQMSGMKTQFYWSSMAIVFFYDLVRPALVKILGDVEDAANIIESMAVVAARTLLRFNDIDVEVVDDEKLMGDISI